jgi:hypothetical protein
VSADFGLIILPADEFPMPDAGPIDSAGAGTPTVFSAAKAGKSRSTLRPHYLPDESYMTGLDISPTQV